MNPILQRHRRARSALPMLDIIHRPTKRDTADGVARVARLIVVAWVLGVAGGCGRPILSVSDAVRMEGIPSLLTAYAERSDLVGAWEAVEGVEVTFFVGGNEVARAVTDGDGYAGERVTLSGKVTQFTARAVIDGKQLEHEGVVYHWNADRTIIVSDVDGTICWTDFEQLYLNRSNKGTVPVDGARETLRELTPRFNIAYLSARPRILLGLTKEWLDQNDFPSGPIVTASSIDEGLDAERFKTKSIREHKKYAPYILIGIGNLDSDSEAYAANNMLTLIRHKADDKQFRAHAIVLPDWASIREFFAANAELLEDPAKLDRAIREGHMLVQPQFPYHERR